MEYETRPITNIQVDVGVLKEQVLTLTSLCSKMDEVIERLINQHDRHIEKVYDDMEKRRLETESDIKEIHDRIDTVLDKVQGTELRIMKEIKSLHEHMLEHNKQEKKALDEMNKWKWMIYGGIVVVTWALAHSDLNSIIHLFIK
jgi:SMC interacting uncharacterized protein involved in chromosome segregation